MELSGTKIRPFFRLGAAASAAVHIPSKEQNKTGTSGQGMLYVDNQGMVRLAGAGSV
jgi:hypothetical protein